MQRGNSCLMKLFDTSRAVRRVSWQSGGRRSRELFSRFRLVRLGGRSATEKIEFTPTSSLRSWSSSTTAEVIFPLRCKEYRLAEVTKLSWPPPSTASTVHWNGTPGDGV